MPADQSSSPIDGSGIHIAQNLRADFALSLAVSPPVGRGSLLEWVGMLLESPVTREGVPTTMLTFAAHGESADDVVLEIRRNTSGWVPPGDAMEMIFRVWHGITAMGFTIKATGSWEECFSTKPNPRRRATIPTAVTWMHERPLAGKRTPQRTTVELKTLEGIHRTLTTLEPFSTLQRTSGFQQEFPEHRSLDDAVREILLPHVSGLEVWLELKDGFPANHRILGSSVPLTPAQQKSLAQFLQKVSHEPVPGELAQLPFAKLASSMGKVYAPFLRALGEEFESIEQQSDYGRYPRQKVQAPEMTLADGQACGAAPGTLTLQTLLDAGLPAATLKDMGIVPGTPLDSPESVADWFALSCGPHRLYGNNVTRKLVWQEQPASVYRI